VTEIAIYAEGGGDTTHQKAELRVGLDGLLNNVKSKAREEAPWLEARMRWRAAGDL
jgi:hypothetical protein